MASLIFPEQVGQIGIAIRNILHVIGGKSSIALPFFLLIYSFKLMFNKDLSVKVNNRFIGIVIFYWTFLMTNHVFSLIPFSNDITPKEILNVGLQGFGGGVLGALLSIVFLKGLGLIGTIITSISFMIIGIILILDISLSKVLEWFGKIFKNLYKQLINLVIGRYRNHKEKKAKKIAEEPMIINDTINDQTEITINTDKDENEQIDFTFHDYNEKENNNEKTLEEDSELPQKDEEGNIVIKFPQKKKNLIQNIEKEEQSEDLPKVKKLSVPYVIPPLTLLQKAVRLKEGRSKGDIEQQAKTLIETLNSFGVSAKITHIHRGPTITRFELQPAVGVKVSRILNLSDDLALSLASAGIRIEAPIPGKAAIGIEVPNTTKASVYLREVIESNEFMNNSSKLTVALGKNIAGETLIADFTQMPHILIAGATGSGKSVCVNTIINSILFKATPEEVKFLMVDPKVVELNIYNGIPHLLAPVVTDPKNAAFALKKVVKEMEHRYEQFAKLGVRDINRYNSLNPDEKLPYIVVIIDELADLMMVAPNDVEDCICRLAQMARASGIHLIVATQRPSVDVITGVIKANITSRIAFAVSSQADSRTILDMGGAEKLLGKGDMLFYPVGASKPIRAQSSFISDEEVENIVSFVKENQTPEYDETFEVEEKDFETYDLDELFEDAAKLVVDSQQASISLLQRRFRIGYTRAARIVDDLEKMGIVGGFEGSKARQVLVTELQLEEILKSS
ncbi:DNA translocase FtsK [Alkalicella caledoniensis]|uniref:DNA translocase FtsK n=2 Tax=Alkalicella caledoniensis TaxID=2731377 RepID=A0A7G9WDJ2_ALKCA|nr:DNA translocase FtsK [Alkalicella caledoniensis]